ncbi:MAG: hypothetical protein NC041_02030 [Bacteroides sp.]|nr:hypothetical protein [Prevotella sp.]MCM1407619.1 hypothetical protein [Treponema brennaborense]MCM1469231.1 hypothetical protein [Bacteroides sp.]
MKKVTVIKIIFICTLICCSLSKMFSAEIRIGGQYVYTHAVFDYSDFAKRTYGGTISGEISFDYPRIIKLGTSVHASLADVSPSSNDIIVSSLAFFSGGFWVRVPFGKSGFSFQPEIEYGIVFSDTKTDETTSSRNPEVIAIDTYKDQFIQFSAALRFSFRRIPFEIDAAPLFLFSPEKVSGVHLLGFRAGLLFCADRK